ncbi:hypothetical protein [Actinomadura decatromicini]|uniref:Uncharacterized protein n=1 Tax=Actinomadura decatromicini TaxID=2604572 RepID=A0A5D3FED5_9ACTN|nr:hypothetical protein [Actinomadura decatromicini]TYK46190.1 hypothetical protein FXF68_28800 [Actinomadura decatromicini]
MRDDEQPATPSVNYGIVSMGGTHYVANQAVGQNAQAFSNAVTFNAQNSNHRAQASELLAVIERLLEEHRAALTDPDGAAREVQRVREELDEDEPQLPFLRRALDRLNTYAEPVAPLVAAVGQLTQTVQAAIGGS